MGELQARILTIDDRAYHADPCERPSLSQSIARILLDKSPRHAHFAHPKLGAGEREERKVFDAGKLVHKLVLGKGADIVVVDAADWRTKAAQTARDEARAAGKIPALVSDYDDAKLAALAARDQLAGYGLELRGESEVAVTWREPVSGHADVLCRGMLDNLFIGRREAVITDIKTSSSAHPRACASHVVSYGYDVQQAAYTRAVEDLYPELAGRVDFVFAFIEIGPPVCVTVGRLDGVLRERGERRWRSAVALWAECLAFDSWPAYAVRPITIEAPPWVFATMPEIES